MIGPRDARWYWKGGVVRGVFVERQRDGWEVACV